jgi:heavy metal sensor kinase
MFRSVRIRIALACFAVAAVILPVSAAGVYLLLRDHLYRQLDSSLGSAVQTVETSLTHELLEHTDRQIGEEEFRGIFASLHLRSFPQQAMSVFQGTRLVAEEAGDSHILVPHSQTETGARQEESGNQLTTRLISGEEARAVTRFVSLPDGVGTYTIVAAQSLNSVEVALSGFRWALLILVPAMLILSAVGGYYLARASLRPVVGMAEEAEKINSASLSESLTVPDSGDELGLLACTFNRLLGRLHTASEQQKRFMADASHELRTPLSVSFLTAQVALESERPGEEYREALTVVRNHIQSLNRLVHDMLTLASSDAGGRLPRKKRCHLEEIILDAIRSASVLARSREIRIGMTDTPESPMNGDAMLIHQLFVILLDNAIKFSPPQSAIHVTLGQRDGSFEVDISDSGCGVPEPARPKIFERFFRADPSRSRAAGAGGSGLGLPIASWIASEHGGTVELLESSTEPGHSGSTFRVKFPSCDLD